MSLFCTQASIFEYFHLPDAESSSVIATTSVSTGNKTSSSQYSQISSSSSIQPVSYDVTPDTGTLLLPTGSITLIFSETMNTTVLTTTGDLATEIGGTSVGIQWQKTTFPEDTLIISPEVSWSEGVDRQLSLEVQGINQSVTTTITLTYIVDNTAPTVQPVPEPFVPLLPTESLLFKFSESIDQSTVSIVTVGSLSNAESTWSSDIQTNDTLTLTPSAATWGSGAGTVTVSFSDLYGNQVTDKIFEFTVTDDVIYVNDDATGGNGSIIDPYDSIQSAITAAGTPVQSISIFVAQGTYMEDIQVSVDNISIYGGFAEDFSHRSQDPSLTTIQSSGGSSAVLIENVSSGNSFDGFSVYASSSSSNHALRIVNSAIHVQHCVLSGGMGGNSFGIKIESSDPAPALRYNVIDGGEGSSYSRAIDTNVAPAIIQNNRIIAGRSNTQTVGIYVYDTNALIQNNMIYCEHSAPFQGIYLDSPGPTNIEPTIENNLIFSTSGHAETYGIIESDMYSDFPSVRAQNIFGCTYLYHDYTEGLKTNLSDTISVVGGSYTLNTLLFINETLGTIDSEGYYTGNFDGLTFHIGGVFIAGVIDDFNHTPRTDPLSIGPYEYDAP